MLVENPDETIRLKACLQLSNKKFFDLIQNVQKETLNQRKTSFEALKVLDRDIDQFMETVQKIKNREVKRELMDQILECKVKVAKVIEVIRSSQLQQMTNIQIAQLNDCAYKAIRKVGVQKKLDERALKNESFFNNMEKKLQAITKGMNVDKVKANWQEIIAELGNCPLSQSDTLELM